MTITSTHIFEGILALATVVSAGALCAGAYVANAQISTWRKEKIETRKSEIAEETLVSLFRLERSFTLAVSEVRHIKNKSIEDEIEKREAALFVEKLIDDFDYFDLCRARCLAITRNEELEKSLKAVSNFRLGAFNKEGFDGFVPKHRVKPAKRAIAGSITTIDFSPLFNSVRRLEKQMESLFGKSDLIEQFASASERVKTRLAPIMRMDDNAQSH